jgi:hypothetical protein
MNTWYTGAKSKAEGKVEYVIPKGTAIGSKCCDALDNLSVACG